jgi:hypothetical protein
MSNTTSGLENVLKSLSKTFKGGTSATSALARTKIKPAVVGGAADLDQLLDKLHLPTSSASDKIKAAELIRASIEESAVSSIPEIWYSARDLISGNYQTECRRAGLRLMKSCIAHDEHSTGARISYYKALIKHSNLEDFDLQLDSLRTLTNDGRDLLDLYQSGYPLPHVLSSWLKRLASETQEIRIGRKKDITLPWGTSVDENFHDMMRYIINTLKFNIAAYEEADLEVILRETVGICRKTSDKDDIGLSCDLINTVMVYGIIPINSLRNILEILCGISITVDDLADKAWDSVLNLAKSHIGNNTFQYLCDILKGTNRKEVNSNTMRGAARFLQRLLHTFVAAKGSSSSSREMFDMSIANVLASYKKSLDVESVRHGLEICSCVYDILNTEATLNCINYEVWESEEYAPLEIVYQISRSSLVRQRSRKAESTQSSDSKDTASKIIDLFYQIFHLLSDLLHDKQFKGPNEVVIDFFIDMSPFLDEATALVVIDHFAAMHYCNPMSLSWIENTETLVNNFLFDLSWSAEVRLRALKILRTVYLLGTDEDQRNVIRNIAERAFGLVDLDIDTETLQGLLDFFIYVAQDCSYQLFTMISDILMRQFLDPKHRQSTGSKSSFHSSWSPDDSGLQTEKYRYISRAMAELFVKVFRTLPRRARYLYFNLVAICQRTINEPRAFIEASRVLCRIRSTSTNHIYLSQPRDTITAATKLGKETNKEDSTWHSGEDIPYLDGYLDIPSPVLKRLDPGQELEGSSTLKGREYQIDATVLLDVIANVIEFGAHWEVYTFVWTYFPPQLTNLQLFNGCSGEILRLRKILCDQISNSKLPPSVILPGEISKHDVMVLAIYTLPTVISYGDVFSKTDYDYIVQSLVLGLSSWERTGVPCIHALVVCCYECPLSVKKFLGQIFAKFQTKITTTLSSPHILELLLSLSRLPWLTDNFTQDEYKRVFGMAFTYIKHANDLSQKAQAEDLDRIMSQYLLALAYSAISSWFLTIKLANRRHMATFITRNLILADGKLEDIDEQSMATLDLISRFTFSDLDLLFQPTITKPSNDKNIVCKRWLYGKSIVAIETNQQTGESEFVVRRPTGTTLFNIKPDDKMIPKWLRESSLQEPNKLTVAFSPSYYLLQLVVANDVRSHFNPIPIKDDPQTNRAIAAIDRAPVVDFHKVSVLFVGHGQHTEQDILANSTGSKAYRSFLSRLGTLVRLKGNRNVYTGGLDTEMDIDGEFAYAWNDKITQTIFHTATMMPLPANPQDVSISSKKRHIGNNYVTIYFDESGLPFNFDTVKSQFNFINIVISPHTEGFADVPGAEQNSPGSKNYYKVQAYCKEGVPELFAACHVKIVSEESLPIFVRNLAIIASKFATVFHSGGQYVSNWRYRLQQINVLHERVASQQNEIEKEQQQLRQKQLENEEKEPVQDTADVGLSFLDQLASATNVNSVVPSEEPTPSLTAATFVPDNDQGQDLPLLKALDFSSFTG